MLLNDNKLKQVILTTTQKLEQEYDKELKLFLMDKLDVLLFVLEELSDMSLYELFQDSMLVEDIEMVRV